MSNIKQTDYELRVMTSWRRVTTLLIALVAIMMTISVSAHANSVNTSTGLTAAGGPLAIHGYDAVSYFTEGRARVGKAVHSVKHGEAVYRFYSEDNMRAFEAAPERYLPRYGGYCAFGVSVGAKFDGDPTLFRVVDGGLYFNLNPEIQKQWLQDIDGNIRKADRNWAKIRDREPSELN